MGKTVILEGARTPFGKLNGALSTLSAPELGGIAIKEALNRSEVAPGEVDYVIMGTVLQGGQGQLPSRQAARHAGIPWEAKTETINKVCASGMRAIALGDLLIRAKEAEIVVAGGMESMTNAPFLLPRARKGYRLGHGQILDSTVFDGLTCSFTGVHMGTYGNRTAAEMGLSREEQDRWALRSHRRAIAAMETGKISEEIVPVEVPAGRGKGVSVRMDEALREDTSLERLAQLPPVFDPDGTITAGNAPGINDGACAVVLMDGTRAEREGRKVLAHILDGTSLAVEAKDFPKTPGLVIRKLLEKTEKSAKEIDLFEINEAFAAVVLAASQIAGLDPEKVNVNGGAIAYGHPIGASGARIVLTLCYELRRRGGGLGIAAICSGGGQGDALLIEVPKD